MTPDFDDLFAQEDSQSPEQPEVMEEGVSEEKVQVASAVTGGASRGALDEMYGNWFLDYASYVILERAVPHMNDGLKPVQRRILHSLRDLEDGRYNKVASVVGHAAKYHPHGEVSVYDALVQIGQRDLLVDTQGNWGNLLTGDGAAAARYIEARLTPFALETMFSPKVTEWVASYDGRRQEPVVLPAKFPILLAHGGEGIAVGLSCRVLPHNFNEILEACSAHFRGEDFTLLPDFHTGGIADCTDYQDGARGGRVRVRARIEAGERKNEVRITELPFGVTTGTLTDSITSAHDKGKLKVVKIDDITAEKADIVVHMSSGEDQDKFVQALYAFTDCEISLAPNACVVEDNYPRFVSVKDILRSSAEFTRELLRWELEIRLDELRENWHFSSLEKIFIENRIYRRIEDAVTWDAVLSEIYAGLKPFVHLLMRDISDDDVVKLTEIQIKRISKFDSSRADESIRSLERELGTTDRHLKNLTKYTIDWFENLRKKYGRGRERRTEISSFSRVAAVSVIAANETLSVNAAEGFAGYNLRRGEGEPMFKCSPIDDIVVFRPDGVMVVSRVQEKAFIGRDPLFVHIFRADEGRVYTMIYQETEGERTFAKRFEVGGVTREKEYALTGGGKVLFFAVHETREKSDAQMLRLLLKPKPRLRTTEVEWRGIDFPFSGRGAKGNIVARSVVKRVVVGTGKNLG